MFNLDKTIKNIMGNKKQVTPITKGFNNTFKNSNNIVNNMVIKNHIKGATPKMQNQWKGFSIPVKNIMRQKYKDSDGDRIPDKWDCRPNNPAKTMAFKYPTEQEMKNQGVRRVSYPVKKLYNMRANYGHQKTKTFFDDHLYEEEDRIRTNIEKDWREKNKKRLELNSAVNEMLLDDSIRNNTEWNPERITPPYPTKKQVFNVFVNEKKEQYEKEKGLKLGVPVIKKNISGYGYYAKSPIKYTKEQLQEKRNIVMIPGHTDKKLNEFGPWHPNTPESNKYIEELSQSIKSNEPLVPPIELVKGDIIDNSTGQGRHRITALQKLGQKNVDILVPDKWDYKTELHRGNLKLVVRTPEEQHQWHMERVEPKKEEQHQPFGEWNNMTKEQQVTERITQPDSDNDTVPDRDDCEPNNSKKQDIRWGRKPRKMTTENWFEYQNMLNKITRNEPSNLQLEKGKSPINQFTKMNTILEHDREIKKLNQHNSIFRDDEWHRKYNDEVKNALSEQGYSKETAEDYLTEKNRVNHNFANAIVNTMKQDGSWDKIFNEPKRKKQEKAEDIDNFIVDLSEEKEGESLDWEEIKKEALERKKFTEDELNYYNTANRRQHEQELEEFKKEQEEREKQEDKEDEEDKRHNTREDNNMGTGY